MMGNEVDVIYDIGVRHSPLMSTGGSPSAPIRGLPPAWRVAAQRGGGMVSCPVIAVPPALAMAPASTAGRACLGMLNSCASNRHGGQHRQRLRGRLCGWPDQPALAAR